VRIVSRKTLSQFSVKYPEVKENLDSWYHEVKKVNWSSPQEIKGRYPKSRIIGKDRVIFNILNNRYRLIVKINFTASIIYVRFIGTHKEYDKIDPEEV
jgi:mRNA interferase HigB